MAKATLTKRLEFCASHRYHNAQWDEAKNRDVFGPCNNVNTHGHNYLLEVTLQGEIDSVTGMIINLYDLKIILNNILEQFDHKNLNLDMPFFTNRIPTTENLARTLWDILQHNPDLPHLDTLRLYEDESLYAEVTTANDWENSHGAEGMPSVLIARRYQFSAINFSISGQGRGHNYEMWVSLKGPIPEDTGQVINLHKLDDLVHKHLLSRLDQQDLSRDPTLSGGLVTDSSLSSMAWNILAPKLNSPPVLIQLSISQKEGTLASTASS
ncbi:MAG: 6-carboxytetrahydropterin synthase [Nitrospirales bacterium]